MLLFASSLLAAILLPLCASQDQAGAENFIAQNSVLDDSAGNGVGSSAFLWPQASIPDEVTICVLEKPKFSNFNDSWLKYDIE